MDKTQDKNLDGGTPGEYLPSAPGVDPSLAREAELLREMDAIPMVLKNFTADGKPCYAPADVDRWNAIQAERKALAGKRAPAAPAPSLADTVVLPRVDATKKTEIPLPEDLRYWRAERPDEWIMDRFIRKADALRQEVERLTREKEMASAALACPVREVKQLEGERDAMRKALDHSQMRFESIKLRLEKEAPNNGDLDAVYSEAKDGWIESEAALDLLGNPVSAPEVKNGN